MDVSIAEDLFWDTLAKSTDPPSSNDIIKTLQGYMYDVSPPETTAAIARKIMKVNPDKVRNPEPDPVTDEYEPDAESLAVTLLFNLVIARPSSTPKVLDLLEAIWGIDEKEEGVVIMNRRTWVDEVGEVCRSYRANRYGNPMHPLGPDPRECARRWAAINELKAHEWMRRDEGGASFREVDHGFEAISLALEQEAWLHKPTKVPGNRRPLEWEVGMLDVEVPAAAAWLRIAGPKIYRYVNERKFGGPQYRSQVGIRSLYGEKVSLWHGEAGLSHERWDFWKMRLREIKGMDCLLGETRSCADNVEAIMEAIETDVDANTQTTKA